MVIALAFLVNGIDDYGFSGLPGGYRAYYGDFYTIGHIGLWWSATDSSTSHAWRRYLNYSATKFYRYYHNKKFGFSVRCVRD
jgi:uncharacterized protein (TIGR02145 family)